ncbi:hypothetical protein PG991_013943 [Apiospora marii]|uniref:Uncharacterized protein n=1 Tax=Apiospora marii TaxID=335849 RepID=A0ABR1R7G2_9PEZI
MSSYHNARSSGTSARLEPGSMRKRPYSTSGGHASGRSSHHSTVDRRHSTAPSSRPAPQRQQQFVPYRPPVTPVAPKPHRPVGPPAWVHDDFDSGPVPGEQQSYFSGYDRQRPETVHEEPPRRTTPCRQSTHGGHAPRPRPSREPTAQEFDEFLETAPRPKRRSFWSRIFCGSHDDAAPTRRAAGTRGLVSASREQPPSRRPTQPSVAARRRARHAGDEDEPYLVKTGRDGDTGRTFYAPRYDG